MDKMFFLLLLVLVACQNNPPEALPSATDYSACPANHEYLSLDSILINGAFSARTDKATLLKYLGEPDQTFTMRPGSHLQPLLATECVYWYGGSSFRVLDDDNIIPYEIDLTDGRVRLQFRGVVLDHQTPPRVIQQLFPLSGRQSNGAGNLWHGYIPIHTRRNGGEDYLWLFVFEAERLVRVKLVMTL